MADNLGSGLVYNDGTSTLQVRLSSQAGNALSFTAEGGLYAPTGGTPPTPATCLRTIASLPAAPNTVGAYTNAMLRGPYSSPYQLKWCLRAGADIVHFRCATSSDGVGVVPDYDNHRMEIGRSNIYVSRDIRELNSSTIAGTYNYAGDENDPMAYAPVTPVRTDRKGGWYGYLAQRYYQPLVADMLTTINGTAVALLDCVPADTATYPESVAIIGGIRAIQQYCAQAWAMIGVSTLANATTVKNAGITPCMLVSWPSPYNLATLPYPVADLQAAGVTWMVLPSKYADSVFTTYKNAGIQVLMWSNSRHTERARAATLGVRGALCGDPVYYRGPNTSAWPYDYRTEVDPWAERKVATGQLTYRTDNQAVSSGAGNVRGRPDQDEPGLFIPASFGSTLGRPTVLCGWLCPLVNPSNYTLTWDMKWTSLATISTTRAKLGLLFGAATDRDTLEWPQGNATLNPEGWPDGNKAMYRVYQRQNGEIGIAKWSGSTFSYLATLASPAIANDVWNSYTLRVTPTQITFTRRVSNGTAYTVTAADSQYRGGYVWVEKEEGVAGDTANPFAGAFRSLLYTNNG
ncbi:hypothetical protein [Streptomyces longwoodensis]|uniref:hypothetical protein n=1 Tax=Streptomyces longwoodensis TaxID=68231 RepID=UPI0036FC52D1